MQKLINLAIIGGSLESTIGQTHIKSIISSGKYNIVCGFFSRKKKVNYNSAKKYNIPKDRVYHNLSNLIKNEKNNIDIAVVLTPPNNRYKIFKELANNSIGIISEKPIENNLKDAKKIFNLIKNKKIFFSTTYNYLGYPAIMEIKPLIKKRIGKVQSFVFEMPQQSFIYKRSNIKKWRLNDKNIPNLYLDLTSHLLSLIYYFFDEYPKAISNFASKNNKYKIVDNSYAWLKFKSFYGSFWVSKNATGQRNKLTIRIFGTKGSIKWKHNSPENIIFCDNDGNIEIIDRLNKKNKYLNNNKYHTYVAGHPNGFLDAFTNIYAAISEIFFSKKRNATVPFIFDLNNTFKIQSILNIIHKASKKDGWIRLLPSK
jgi:predicted dehydrogenase